MTKDTEKFYHNPLKLTESIRKFVAHYVLGLDTSPVISRNYADDNLPKMQNNHANYEPYF